MDSRKTEGIALVTGAASGIGRESAIQLAIAGASGVIFADLNFTGAQEAAEESRKYAIRSEYRALPAHVDVGDEKSVQAVVDLTIKEFGRIDYCVNAAGVSNKADQPIYNLDLGDYDATMKINGRGTLLITRAVSKAMSEQTPLEFKFRNGESRPVGRGSIVNIGSADSEVARKGHFSYTATKHVVRGVTRAAASDGAHLGIRVNAVLPAYVETDMSRDILTPAVKEMISTVTPPGRVAQPEEVADAVVFLCSPAASYISGEVEYVTC